MVTRDAGDGSEMACARPEGGVGDARLQHDGRKPPAAGLGASNTTARPMSAQSEAKVRLMELVVSRENMMAALARVVGNKGAAGVDQMTVTELKPFLKAQWPRIKEELLADRYQPQAVRGLSSPNLAAGCAFSASRYGLHNAPCSVRVWEDEAILVELATHSRNFRSMSSVSVIA